MLGLPLELVAIVGVLGIALLIYKVATKDNSLGDNPPSAQQREKTVRPFASTSIGGQIENIFGGIVVVGIITIVGIGALLGIFIILGVTDAVTDGKVQEKIDTAVSIVKNEPLPRRSYRGSECNFKEVLETNNGRLSSRWVRMTLCKKDNGFLVFVPSGQKPEIKFRNPGDTLLSPYTVSDFIRAEHTWGKPGGMPNLWSLFIAKNTNGFISANLDSVELIIRSSNPQTANAVHNSQKLDQGTLRTAVRGSPCSTVRGKFKTLTAENECRVVTFKRNEKYYFAGKEEYCPRAAPGDAGSWVHLGGTQYNFIPHHSGVTVTFYLQKKGHTFMGNLCS